MKKISLLFLLLYAIYLTQSFGQVLSGIQASYPFAGSANDISANANHGIITGSVLLTTDRFGYADCAYDFGGDSSSYITIPYDISLDYGGGSSISISLWYKGGTLEGSDFECLFGHRYGTGSRPYSLYLSIYDVNRANFCDRVWEPLSTTDTFGLEWHHLVGIYNDDDHTIVMYKDNVLIGTEISPVFPFNTSDFVIGRSFDGQIDDIRVYNRIISAEEVDTLFNLPSSCATTGIKTSNLSSYKFYPNPSSGIVTIESTEALKGTILTVHDVMGRIILQKTLDNSNLNFIDLKDQPDGVYFIRLQNGSEQKTEVLQKIH